MENMVLDTGHLDAKEIKKVNLNIWINKASMFDGHFHGMVVFELIDQLFKKLLMSLIISLFKYEK